MFITILCLRKIQGKYRKSVNMDGLNQCKSGWWVLRKDAKRARKKEKESVAWKVRGQFYQIKIRQI